MAAQHSALEATMLAQCTFAEENTTVSRRIMEDVMQPFFSESHESILALPQVPILNHKTFLASQDAIEVMLVTDSLTD